MRWYLGGHECKVGYPYVSLPPHDSDIVKVRVFCMFDDKFLMIDDNNSIK
jgi:hypothetical protein